MLFRKVFVLLALLCLPGLLHGSDQKSEPEVAPGLSLPSIGTVFSLDSKDGKPALVQIHASEVALNTHAGSNFARSAVYSGPRMTAEVKGLSAPETLHASPSAIYVRLPGDDPDLLKERVHLLQLKPEKDSRSIAGFSMNVFGGGRKRHLEEVPVAKAVLDGSMWLKLTPNDPLKAGDYGIVVLPKDVNAMPETVYDFGVEGK